VSGLEGFSDRVLLLRLSPSRLNAFLHFGVLAISLPALWINGRFDLPLKYALSLCIVMSVFSSLYRQVLLLHSQSVVELIFDGDLWRLRYRDGSLADVAECKPIYVGSWFIVVQCRTDTGALSVVIARDSSDGDSYRRSLVFFRFGGATLS
jgi:hypothetical protein